ncbi:glycosyltransferase [Peribacillus frigoritolerans]|uniref:glycosyltransferase n=1 Tax=Peribacillus frigoritolerans TaxID=450367 RepID=UPI00105980DB|nr:glycosyltransferase [Peribacillus frigoritolerans]TDL78993.1 glycosyltransferase family 1 protein [Peribacillus frigoritolerans]
MIRVLHVISSLGGGGVESMLFNYYSHLDRSEVQFDFIVHGDNIGMLEEKFHLYDSKIFHVTPKKVSLWKNILEINKIIKEGKYDVVHCHQNFSNASTLVLAKMNHVPIRISHAHGSKEVNTIKEKVKNQTLRFINSFCTNYFFSCGIKAGKWLHGEKWSISKKNILMNNAIDVDKFSYNFEIRQYYREKYKFGDEKVLLHVGRFSDEKNHLFMINIIEQLSKRSDNYILLLAGNGPLEGIIKKCVKDKGLTNKVIFLGVRNDISELMNAADIFLLPSKHEGFPVTLVEAQSTGMIVFASNKITKETAITDLINYLPIEKEDPWVEEIVKSKIEMRNSRRTDVEKGGYSIEVQAQQYQKWLDILFQE